MRVLLASAHVIWIIYIIICTPKKYVVRKHNCKYIWFLEGALGRSEMNVLEINVIIWAL